MKQSTKICIAYTGEAVNDGTMDVNELAPALLELSKLIGRANRILNRDESTVEVRISAHLEHGSFEMILELVRNFTDQIKLFFTEEGYSIVEIMGVLGFASTLSTLSGVNVASFIQFMRWLKCRKIKKVETVNKDVVRIILDDDSREISIGAWNLYRSKEIHKHFEGVISPLQKKGVDGFEVRDGDNRETIERISDSETTYFSDTTLEPTEEIRSTQRIILKIVNVNFERDLKWRFDDGESKFFADVKDEDFLNAVDSGVISFTQGDTMVAELETIQQYTKTELKKTTKSVIKVLTIIKRDDSGEINFHSPEDDSSISR